MYFEFVSIIFTNNKLLNGNGIKFVAALICINSLCILYILFPCKTYAHFKCLLFIILICIFVTIESNASVLVELKLYMFLILVVLYCILSIKFVIFKEIKLFKMNDLC